MKSYKLQIWLRLLGILFFIGFTIIFFQQTDIIDKAICAIGIILFGALSLISFLPVIALDKESLVLHPIYKRWSKKIKWGDVFAIYTLEGPSGLYSSLRPKPYIIPTYRTDDKAHDEIINFEITQDKNNKQAKDLLLGLIKDRKIHPIPPVQKYYELLEEICKRSTNAIIDEETKELIIVKKRGHPTKVEISL